MNLKKYISFLLLFFFSVVLLPKELFHQHDDHEIENTSEEEVCELCEFTFSSFVDTEEAVIPQIAQQKTLFLPQIVQFLEKESVDLISLRGPPSLS